MNFIRAPALGCIETIINIKKYSQYAVLVYKNRNFEYCFFSSQYCGFLICIVLKEKLIIQIYHALASFMIICFTLMLILIYYALASFTIIPSALHAKILKILNLWCPGRIFATASTRLWSPWTASTGEKEHISCKYESKNTK